MPERKPRADAARNREAVLAAADDLFAACARPEDVTMAEIAAAAGVGKGTLFRGFGDRTGLVRALYEARTAPLRTAVESGPAPLGPGTPPAERLPALLDTVLCFKLDHRHLSLALEGGIGSPYTAEHYAWFHATVRGELARLPGRGDGDFAAHALLAAVSADLVDHLVDVRGYTRERLRAELAEFTARVLGEPPPKDAVGAAAVSG